MKKQDRSYQLRSILGRISPMVLLMVLFALGVAMRAPEVISGNQLFGFDQGRDYMAVYDIVANRKLTLIGAEVGAGSAGLSGLFHGPGYFYLLSLMSLIFHSDPYGGLLMMFLFGVATLVAVYVTVRRMFGAVPAYIALFLTGISPLIAPQSRFIWNHHPSSLFIVIVLYLVYLIPERPRLYAPLAVFTAGIIYNFELAIAVPMTISVLAALPVAYRLRDVRTYVFSLLAAGVAFLPMVIFEFRHNFMAVRGLAAYFSRGAGNTSGLSVARVSGHISSYISNARNSFVIESGFLPMYMFNGLVAVLLVATVYLALKKQESPMRKFFRFLLILLAVTYGIFLLLNNGIWDYYLIPLHFVYMYIFAILAGYALRSKFSSVYGIAGTVIAAVFLLSMANGTYRRLVLNYTVDLPDYGGMEKTAGKRAVIDYVYTQTAGKPFNVMEFVPPVYTYPYDYLFATYGKEKYGYVPGKDLSGDVYLIIEPDGKGWYKGWLDTVVNGGTVLSTDRLNTGHIVIHKRFLK